MKTTTADEVISRFQYGQPVFLTIDEELMILSEIDHDRDYINNGSSRVVYGWRDKFVVKVAMAVGGQNQNQTEKDFYFDFHHHGIFAPLYAYGRMINIMLRLQDCTYYDLYDVEEEDPIWQTIELADELTEYDGGDNGQIGYNEEDSCWQLYDYGYSNNFEREEIVDDVQYWMDYINPIDHAKECISWAQYYTKEEMNDLCRDIRRRKHEEEEECE